MKILLYFIFGLISFQTYAKKCAYFSSQKEAQSWYEQRKKSGQTGWKSLDRDIDEKKNVSLVEPKNIVILGSNFEKNKTP